VGRVAVIGAGVVGACIGYYLTREGADVLLVDGGLPGELTTSRSFAWVNASTKIGHPAYFDLNFAGMREYECLVAEFADATWWNPVGHVRWDYRDEQQLAHHVERLQARGYPAEVWTGERLQRRLEPNVVLPSPSAPVAVFPSEAWVDGPTMARALVASAVKRGATAVFENAVSNIGVTDGAVTSIELASGETYPVEAVVNAAGPEAPKVAALVGRALPMKREPGLAVRVEMSEGLIGRVLHAPEIAMRPDEAGRGFLLARSVESALDRAGHVSSELVENVTRLAARVVPEFATAAVVDARVGHRAIPVDGFPAIGKAADIDGYYEAVTHSGITLGPIVGRTLSAEILYCDIDPLVSTFRASRLGSTCPRGQWRG
jgi:glycine/D-amino acid oxidase-like deaminating enzyme